MLITLKMLLRTLILPPAGPLIVAIVGLLMLRRRRRVGITLATVGVGALWLLSTPIVADSLTRAAERYPALDLTRPVQAQAIVILGGGGLRLNAVEFGGGPTPEMELLERLSYGAFVARKTSLPILVTGAPDEALAMQTSLTRDFGLSPRWIENRSRDTFDNARYSAPLLRADGVKRIVLVTSSTHLWHAAHEFQAAGFDVVPAPIGLLAPREQTMFRFVPGPSGLLRSHMALYELLGEPVRVALAALHIRRQSTADPR
jgi:uncharacterized SAM-binding protein YcdF (DUF218 family)